MKILISGRITEGTNNTGFIQAFQELGLEVRFFDTDAPYQAQFRFLKESRLLKKVIHRLFWKLLASPIQDKLIEMIKREKPDLILILKGWLLKPHTITRIKEENPVAKILCFNPDNPFNTWHHGSSNVWIRKSIPLYDIYFIWGKFLIDPLLKAGAKRV